MKIQTKCLLFAVCLFFTVNANACDVCGGVNSALGLGTGAQGNRTLFGLNFSHRNYTSTTHSLLGTHSTTFEQFNRLEAIAQIKLSEKWQMKGTFVYSDALQLSEDKNVNMRLSGIGDASISTNYFIANNVDSTGNKSFRWSVGLGAKLPTGKFTTPHSDSMIIAPGTGSFDALAQSNILFRYKKWSFINEIQFGLPFQNKYEHRRGISLNTSIYVLRKVDEFGLFGGVQVSYNGTDYISGARNSASVMNSFVVLPTLGSIYKTGDFMFQGNFQKPIWQTIADGHVKQNFAFTLSAIYLLN